MKYFSLFIALLIFGCQPEQPKPAKLSATISNTKAEEFSLSGMGIQEKLPVQDGKVVADLDISKAGLYSLRFGRTNIGLYMTPGDEITISADAQKFDETVKIEGPHEAIQTYIKEKGDISSENLGRDLFSSGEEKFMTRLKTVADKKLAALAPLTNSAEFVANEKKAIKFKEAHLK